MTRADMPRILVVEDEPLIRMLAVDMLDALGYGVVEASSGDEALAIDDETLKAVAALMIDLGLPDHPGEVVAKRLRERRPDLPVILTTGADVTSAHRELAGGGAVGVLEKPYQFNDLQGALGIVPAAARSVV